MDTVYYFGYGANKDIEMIRAITGNEPEWGKPGTIKGYKLYLQSIPEIKEPRDLGQNDVFGTRSKLTKNFGNNFKSYVVKKHENSMVHGTIWKLSGLDLALINNWEQVGEGWYKVTFGKAETIDKTDEYITYIQYIDVDDEAMEEVIEENYQTFPANKQNMLDKAIWLREKTLYDYSERLKCLKNNV